MKQASWGSHRHSAVQSQGREEIWSVSAQRALSRTRRLWCILAAKSRDHCMYHGSSSAACTGSNITLSSEGTPWSTPAVSTRVWVAGDEVAAPRELLADVHPAFKCGKAF